ncbi:MAG: class I SAM-dependent methyltransferase [Nitrospinae bacterium]|nr:class I SAM-dependent methyltransferase [Nitrospinota bacterium]
MKNLPKNKGAFEFLGALPEDTKESLEAFTEELIRWNKKLSLTAVPDVEIMEKLIAPSAWLGMEYSRENIGIVADFGSGPGVPGFVMALCDNRNKYLLVESKGKKAAFLREVARKLGLGRERVEVANIRMAPEAALPPVQRLVSRAAGDLAEVMGLWRQNMTTGGSGDFFKGSDAKDEIKEFKETYPNASAEILKTPDWFGDLVIVRARLPLYN